MSELRADMKNVVLYMPEQTDDIQRKYAKKYSEGCPELEELLLFMWGNGINTFSCCAGHEPEHHGNSIYPNEPFILFDIRRFNNQELRNLITKLIILNESSKISFLEILVESKLFDSKEFMKSVEEGNIEGDFFERHSIELRFNDKNNKHFKELLEILQSVKLKNNALMSKLKNKLKQFNIKMLNFKDFVNAVARLNDFSLEDYNQVYNGPFNTIRRISLEYNRHGLVMFHKVETERPKGYKKLNIFTEVAEGYFSIDYDELDYRPKYMTVKNDEIVEISQEEAKHLKQYKVDYSVESVGEFDKERMQKVFEKIENATKVELNQ